VKRLCSTKSSFKFKANFHAAASGGVDLLDLNKEDIFNSHFKRR
jgi:hypothetical protein